MGYGKKSENKEDQMALDKEEAEVRERIPDEESTLSEGEIAMEIDFPTPRDTQALDLGAVVKKSTLDIIQDAMASCHVSAELREAIMTNYKDFYGTEQLEYKYNLLESNDGTPVILVPKCYKVTEMPAKLEDIGSRWRELGNVKLLDEFMSKFIKIKQFKRISFIPYHS
ncbi:hypothetical protein OS493_024471 [Desmophyllum pertusum]|uniref:Uncharacterized protein n=1 Tax=Desmophyllum pertusum TaxID=174260 RepID=A0A9W9YBX4_9CNID|nr:hypothetical protein OS493_024471 [Desmophyllum pertusum]